MIRLVRALALFLTFVVLFGCRRVPNTSGPLAHEAYIWQRSWTPEVAEGVAVSRSSMQRFVVFAGQITLVESGPKIARPDIDYRKLKAAGRPVGLALRVDPYAGPFRSDDEAIRLIVGLARERLAEARRHGLEALELHFDFDCAESKLGGYRIWLHAVREAVAPVPVYPTVLPSWLKHNEFERLARESGRYILQVHCVTPPRTIADTRLLTDPQRAAEWVRQAARIGVPFRVALPTYTYLVAFDSAGKPIGVSAEGPSARWPKGTGVSRWEADPRAIAKLVTDWTRERPAMMEGIIWYRLPINSDSLNWRWVTLRAVMQGRVPVSDLRIESTDAFPSDITIINKGEQDEMLPDRVEASWTDTTLVAVDALADYEVISQTSARVVFRRKSDAALSRLSPGTARPIGWIRCEKPARIRVVEMSDADRAGVGTSPLPQDGSGDGN